MASERKIAANRANARRRKQAKSSYSHTRSARNALRHGLSLPVQFAPALSEEVKLLAQELAGSDANAEQQLLARRIVEAQIELRRVRHARHQLLHQLSDAAVARKSQAPYRKTPIFGFTKAELGRNLRLMLRGLAPLPATQFHVAEIDEPTEDSPKLASTEGPSKLARVVWQNLTELLAIERYERRALSRRKFAIRAFDALRCAGGNKTSN